MPDFDLDQALATPTLPVCKLCDHPMAYVSFWNRGDVQYVSLACGSMTCMSASSVTKQVQVKQVLVGGECIAGEALEQAKLGRCPSGCGPGNLEHFGDYVRNDHVGSRWDCAECGAQWEIIWEVANA